jgi:probable phosphoglycerate mutase
LFDERPGDGWITAYCDGGSRGNPGPAGFGVYIQDQSGAALAELSEFLGIKTNNFAEYSGLLAALGFALENGYRRLRVVSDSELMVKQIKGQYRVNSPDLKPLYEEAKRRIAKLESFQIQHVLRDKNREADRLANLAMDRGSSGGWPPAHKAERSSGSAVAAAPIPIVRAGAELKPEAAPTLLRGFVKGGVIHLLDGARLPDGAFVKITREG